MRCVCTVCACPYCVLFVDVGRTVPCFKNDSDGYPTKCYDLILNFFLDYDANQWNKVLNDTTDNNTVPLLLNITNSLNSTNALLGTVPKQDVLFDLPYYYIGK